MQDSNIAQLTLRPAYEGPACGGQTSHRAGGQLVLQGQRFSKHWQGEVPDEKPWHTHLEHVVLIQSLAGFHFQTRNRKRLKDIHSKHTCVNLFCSYQYHIIHSRIRFFTELILVLCFYVCEIASPSTHPPHPLLSNPLPTRVFSSEGLLQL